MKKSFLIAVLVLSLIAGISIGYVRGLPNNVENRTVADYGYRCGDGSEFTLVPSRDMSTIQIVPATSVDYVRDMHLRRSDGSYEGDGLTLRLVRSDTGVQLELTVAPRPATLCQSMRTAQESLFQ